MNPKSVPHSVAVSALTKVKDLATEAFQSRRGLGCRCHACMIQVQQHGDAAERNARHPDYNASFYVNSRRWPNEPKLNRFGERDAPIYARKLPVWTVN